MIHHLWLPEMENVEEDKTVASIKVSKIVHVANGQKVS